MYSYLTVSDKTPLPHVIIYIKKIDLLSFLVVGHSEPVLRRVNKHCTTFLHGALRTYRHDETKCVARRSVNLQDNQKDFLGKLVLRFPRYTFVAQGAFLLSLFKRCVLRHEGIPRKSQDNNKPLLAPFADECRALDHAWFEGKRTPHFQQTRQEKKSARMKPSRSSEQRHSARHNSWFAQSCRVWFGLVPADMAEPTAGDRPWIGRR